MKSFFERNEEPYNSSGPAFQRYAHDEYLGGEGGRLRGIGRTERDLLFGSRQTRRALKCKAKLKEILNGQPGI